jgi:hypothetical protein
MKAFYARSRISVQTDKIIRNVPLFRKVMLQLHCRAISLMGRPRSPGIRDAADICPASSRRGF